VFLDPAVSSDPSASLSHAMKAVGLTLVLVKQDGRIYMVDPKITKAPTLLNAQLETMRTDPGSND
jgi:hypothetical protein